MTAGAPPPVPAPRGVRLRAALNRLRRRVARLLGQRMLFGEVSGDLWHGVPRPHTRIAPTTVIEHEPGLAFDDHVFIGPHCFIEASGGVRLGEGVQVTHHVSIVTHSSHRAQRLLGRAFVAWDGPRPGWVAGPVVVGPYCFIGPHSVLEAGTTLGRGCIVRAGSVLRGGFPDFAVIAGNPAQVVGDSREGDARWLARHPELRPLYQAWAGEAAGTPAAAAHAGPDHPADRGGA